MKESIGYTVTLNIIIIFITIMVAFLSASLIYFKSNKISNVITNSIEKYEGYNTLAIDEISMMLSSLGYNKRSIENICRRNRTIKDEGSKDGFCTLTSVTTGQGENGYCIYECYDEDEKYYYFKIRTNMLINIPIVNNILDIPIYSNTNRLYDFEK